MAAEFSTVQPLPARPGAMAAQPVRAKGQVTAGRPLPPRVGELAATTTTIANPAPVVAQAAAPALVPSVQAAPAAVARAAKPDPRPMRLAFGAGAVAAVGALTIGMVHADLTGSGADAEASAGASDGSTSAAAEEQARVRRVTNYVLLKPGEKAPKGAKVISAEELLGISEQPAKADRQPVTKPDRQADPQPAAQPNKPAAQSDRAPQPQPDPPRVTTRQSGS